LLGENASGGRGEINHDVAADQLDESIALDDSLPRFGVPC